MINRIHAALHRPEKGWDPISPQYAEGYGDKEWKVIDESLVTRIGDLIGGFAGKKILDLGSGPGQYAIAFAIRGAEVTCHDVSRVYLGIAKNKAAEFNVSDHMKFSVGYLDEAPQILNQTYDLVFNRVCWYYGFDDWSFARSVFSLVRAGGLCFINTPHSKFNYSKLSTIARFRMWLNQKFSLKIGHPFPPHGRVARTFSNLPIAQMHIDYTDPHHDCIWFRTFDIQK